MTVAARTAEQAPTLLLEPFEDERPALGLEQLDDDHLALAVRREGERAFEILYERLNGPVYGYCCSILGDGAEAEEALQETMIRAYAALRKGGAELRIKPWLYTVARNACIDRLRQRPALPVEIDEGEHASLIAPSAADSYEQRERFELLIRDMGELSERQRSALILRELSGLSLIEIGETLATTPDRAKSLISEARRSLRRSSAVLQAAIPVLPVMRSRGVLANVLASGGATKATGGAAALLGAATAKKLAAAAAVLAIGAGTADVAVRAGSGGGAAPDIAGSAPAAAAAAAATRTEIVSAVAAEPAGGVAGFTPAAGADGQNANGGAGGGSAGGGSTGPGSDGAPGTTSPVGGSVTGNAQGTVNELLGQTQQTVDQTVNQLQGTLNDTVRDVTGGAGGKVKGVTDGIGVKAPDLTGGSGK